MEEIRTFGWLLYILLLWLPSDIGNEYRLVEEIRIFIVVLEYVDTNLGSYLIVSF